jgi:hypothetical protein
VSQCVCNMKRVDNRAREAWGPFIDPQENLAIGVSKTQTCLGRGQICLVRDLVTEELG